MHSCDTYTWSENGQTYTASGTYTVVTGCHTEELVLTITNSTTNTTTASSCDTYTWSENGQTYTASGTYTVVTGCHTEELVLTITNSTTNITTASSCDSYTWSENGQTYTASGTYTVVTGCHTEELVLTITNSTTNTTTASSCDTYTWSENGQTYTASGTYTVVTGCHTEELVLTINSVSDLSTSLTGETITANNNNATYQWLDCDNGNAPIAGATGQSFTATSNGSYAVEITENGCVSNSICTTVSSTSIEDLENSYEITIFPNPTNRAIRIALPDVLLGQTMVLTNGVGQILQTTTITSTSVEYDLSNLADGIYFVQVQTHSGVITKKIVKN
jgi:trimeric autotransporter adhesin